MKHKTLTKAERRMQGKALREKRPRSTHAEWNPRQRSQDIINLLEESNADRIPGLIAVRYGRMAQTPFTFFRGSAIVQARDLMISPVSGITVQACGDCHVKNFGGFATPERNLVFDINDFDETFPGPWEWDIKRLVVSIVLCARDRDFSKKDAEEAVRAAVESYRKRMSEYADMKLLEVWYSKITFDDLKDFFRGSMELLGRKKLLEGVEREEKEANTKTSEAIFPKITTVEGGTRRIVNNPPYIFHFKENLSELEKTTRKFMKHYANTLQADRRQILNQYSHADIAVKVVGIGSVGTRCMILLLLADEDDPIFLQIKEARRSVLEPPGARSRYKNQGQRVAEGQRLMQAASDIFLGWSRVPNGHDYYVRQLRDMKVAPEPGTITQSALTGISMISGWALARAHAKASDGDAPMIAGYLGSSDRFDDALVEYAESYADQVELDFSAFKKAISSGRIHTDINESGDLSFLL
ncbi:MAG: DUF2252 domain-containing protein [Thermodesulfobacteriota bacterium]